MDSLAEFRAARTAKERPLRANPSRRREIIATLLQIIASLFLLAGIGGAFLFIPASGVIGLAILAGGFLSSMILFGFAAIIDLLGRIEINTRPEQ